MGELLAQGGLPGPQGPRSIGEYRVRLIEGRHCLDIAFAHDC